MAFLPLCCNQFTLLQLERLLTDEFYLIAFLFKASEEMDCMTRAFIQAAIDTGSNSHINLLASGELRADRHMRTAHEMTCQFNKLQKVNTS